MSTELTEDKPIGKMHVTSFFGGEDRGQCLQFTLTNSEVQGQYVQLDRDQVLELFAIILKWLLR